VLQVVDGGGAKIFELPTGWLVGGPSVAWREGARHAMRRATRLDELLAAYRAFAGPAMAALDAECPGEAAGVRERQNTIVVVRTADGFAGAHVDWAGELVFPDCRGVSALAPDLPRPVMQQLLDSYQATVQHERDVRRVVRVTAQLFANVHAQTGPDGSVSGDVAIGLLEPSGHRLIGPLPHSILMEGIRCERS
jgi:hypothetical protein